MTTATFYRRPLPEDFVPFASAQGRTMFREALAEGTMEGFFALSEQFHTQVDPAFCGLGSLVVALNALEIDPGRLWKGPWRWFDETLLDCCVPLDQVRERGVTLGELACLARCNGARSQLIRADGSTVDAFRAAVIESARASRGPIVIASYDRSALAQSGTGHYSPIAGYHAERDAVLVLDVARFKYPPHWVALGRMFEAMRTIDPDVGKSRGWVSLSVATESRPIFLSLRLPPAGWRAVTATFSDADRASERACVEAIVQRGAPLSDLIAPMASALESIAKEHEQRVDRIVEEVRSTPAFAAARDLGGERSLAPEIMAVLALVLVKEIETPLGPALEAEVRALRAQLDALCG